MPRMGGALCMRCMKPMAKSAVCPVCGWREDEVHDLQYAYPGTVLSGRYLLGAYLRKNGEGALYAGYDNSLQQKVWIREYFPWVIASRAPDTGRVGPAEGCGAQYKALMSDFVDICNEIRRLGVTEPVVPLENVISENNTVYAIHRGLDLITFEDYLEKHGGKLPAQHALTLLLPIFNTLGAIHARGQIHRGVSPYTIFVDSSGALYLWGFALSATRTAGSELDAELFSGYSAPEQYSPSGWQGSWTDVYASAALLYRTLTGVVPPKSIRVDSGRPPAPISELVPEVPENISEAVAAAMLTDTQDRTQTMQTFVSRLLDADAKSTSVYDTNKVAKARSEAARPRKKPKKEKSGGSVKYVFLGMFFMLIMLGGLIWYFVNEMLPGIIEPTGPASASGSSSVSQPAPPSASQSGSDLMPSFFGMMYSEVEKAPEYERFVFTVKEEYNDNYPEGTIIDQLPIEREKIFAEGTVAVKITVSKGPIQHEMPELAGLNITEAIEILAGMEGVTYEIISRYSATAQPGDVVGTTPEAGVVFDHKRQTVYLFVMPELAVEEGSSRPSSSSEIELGRPGASSGGEHEYGGAWLR